MHGPLNVNFLVPLLYSVELLTTKAVAVYSKLLLLNTR